MCASLKNDRIVVRIIDHFPYKVMQCVIKSENHSLNIFERFSAIKNTVKQFYLNFNVIYLLVFTLAGADLFIQLQIAFIYCVYWSRSDFWLCYFV